MKIDQQFHQFIENALDPIISIDERGTIQSLNSRAEETFGWQTSEWVGRQLLETIVPSIQQNPLEQELKQAFHKRNRNSHSRILEISAVRRDGTLFPAEISITPFNIDNTSRLYIFFKDVSHKKQSASEFRQNEYRYRQLIRILIENCAYSVFVLDYKGKIASWNEDAEKVTGYTAKEIIGKSFATFYQDSDIKIGKPKKALQEAIETGHSEEKGWCIRKDGSRFYANILINSVMNHPNQLSSFSIIIRDISDTKK